MVASRLRELDPGSSVLGDVMPWEQVDNAQRRAQEVAARLKLAGMGPAAGQLEGLVIGTHDQLVELAAMPPCDTSASERVAVLIERLEQSCDAGLVAVTHADEGF